MPTVTSTLSVDQVGSYMAGSGPRAGSATQRVTRIATRPAIAIRPASSHARRVSRSVRYSAAAAASAASTRNSCPWVIWVPSWSKTGASFTCT